MIRSSNDVASARPLKFKNKMNRGILGQKCANFKPKNLTTMIFTLLVNLILN